jgi:hypothetical protein
MTPLLPTFIRLASYERSATAAGITDADERALEQMLMTNPDAGDRVQGTGGLMKIRLGVSGRGKRGGARVLYYARLSQGRIYLLYAYAKNDSSDLTPAGKLQLRTLIAHLEGE